MGVMRKDMQKGRWIRRLTRLVSTQVGFTLVEMLIGTSILAGVSYAALNFYRNQHGQYVQQSGVTDMQQNLRSTMEELSRQIRQAGFGVYGSTAAQILGDDDWLLIRYNDGTAVRTQLYWPEYNTVTKQTDLMTMMDGGASQTFAEGIDSVRFTTGGAGLSIEWIDVELVARTTKEGFETGGTRADNEHLYRRLNSRVNLRNR